MMENSEEKQVLHPLAWGVIIPLALCLVTPLLVNSAFIFPFITTKTLWFRSWVEIAAAFYVLLAWKEPAYRPRWTAVWKAVAAYFAIVVVASLFGENPYRSFWGNIERGEGILTLSHVFVYGFLVKHVLTAKKMWEWFLGGSLTVAVLVSLYALAQYFNAPWRFILHSGEVRLSATIGNASFLAGYLLMHTFIAFWFVVTKGQTFVKVGAACSFVLLWFIIFNTGTRGALISGFIIYLFILVYWFIRVSKGVGKKVSLLAASMLVIAAGIVYVQRDAAWVLKNPTLNRLVSISVSDITTQSRLFTWQSSLKGLLDRPVLGWGYENYNVAFNKYFDARIYRDPGSQIWFDRAHNVVFDVAVTSGLLGLAAYVAIYLSSLKNAFALNNRITGLLFGSLLIAHFLQNMFVFDIMATYIPLMLVVAFLDAKDNRESFVKETAPHGPGRPLDAHRFATRSLIRRGWGGFLIIGTFTALGLALYAFNIRPALANHTGLMAMRQKAAGNQREAFSLYREAIGQGTYQVSEIRNKLAEFALDVKNADDLSEEEKAEIMQFAIDEILNNIAEYPKDAQQYMYLMNLYYTGSKYVSDRLALIPKAGEEALKLSPTRPQIYYLLGQGAVGQRRYDTAIEHFKKAVDLNPQVFDSHWNLAVALRLAGRKAEEIQEYAILESMGLSLNNRGSLEDVNLLRLAQRYISLQDYQSLSVVYQTLVERHPTNIEYLGNLAGALKSAGKLQEARVTAEKLLEINPQAREEVEKFLEEVEKELSNDKSQ